MRWPWQWFKPRTDAFGRPEKAQDAAEDADLAPPAEEPGNAPRATLEDVDADPRDYP